MNGLTAILLAKLSLATSCPRLMGRHLMATPLTLALMLLPQPLLTPPLLQPPLTPPLELPMTLNKLLMPLKLLLKLPKRPLLE